MAVLEFSGEWSPSKHSKNGKLTAQFLLHGKPENYSVNDIIRILKPGARHNFTEESLNELRKAKAAYPDNAPTPWPSAE